MIIPISVTKQLMSTDNDSFLLRGVEQQYNSKVEAIIATEHYPTVLVFHHFQYCESRLTTAL